MVKHLTKPQGYTTVQSTSKMQTPMRRAVIIITLAINLAVLYYIVKLEAKHCNCVMDWRHTYLKYFAIAMIVIKVLRLIGGGSMFYSGPSKWLVVMAAVYSIVLLGAVITNAYSMVTYVGDLNDTKCACAVTEMSQLNKAMLGLRWYYVAASVLLTGMTLYGLYKLF